MVTNNTATTFAHSHTQAVDGLARQLLDTCLIESGSMLTPGVAVWTTHNLAELHGCFFDVARPSAGQRWAQLA